VDCHQVDAAEQAARRSRGERPPAQYRLSKSPPAYLINASVTFHDEQIVSLEDHSIKLGFRNANLMHLRQIKLAILNIGNSQERQFTNDFCAIRVFDEMRLFALECLRWSEQTDNASHRDLMIRGG
jgi:hypothetical protein